MTTTFAHYDAMLRDLRILKRHRPRSPANLQQEQVGGFVELEIEWLEDHPCDQASAC